MEEIKINNIKIDPIIFELGFQKDSSPVKCTGMCCRSGVYVSLQEKSLILENKNLIKKYMDNTQTKNDSLWFENNLIKDEDFPEGLCDSTNIYNDKCVFLNAENKCSLQIAAIDNGFKKYEFKPFFCVTFPVVISENTLTYDDFLLDYAPCCTARKTENPNFIDLCEEELLHILGKDGYIILKEIAKGLKYENIRK